MQLEWWTLEPHPELIQNQSSDWTKRMALAKSAQGDLAVAYLPDNESIRLDVSAFPSRMRSRWFNPKTGESQAEADSTDSSGPASFARPQGWEDALLVLRHPKP